MSNEHSAVTEFRRSLQLFGLEMEGVNANVGIQRTYVAGDRRGTKHGWYVLNIDRDGAWGAYGSWKSGERIGWRFKGSLPAAVSSLAVEPRKPLTSSPPPADLVAIWESAGPADPNHPYLCVKNIPAIRIRQRSGCLMIPLWNLYGKLAGIQCISRSGRKWFYKGSKPSGAFHVLGHPWHVLLIVEGYADGASIHASSDLPVVIAFGAGNLLAVGMALRALYPVTQLIFVADDDSATARNVGLTKATEASEACGGGVILPSELMKGFNNGC